MLSDEQSARDCADRIPGHLTAVLGAHVSVRGCIAWMECLRRREVENAVFFVTANRCGSKRRTAFSGWSQIVDLRGRRVVEAGAQGTVLTADLDLELARDKVIEPQRGGYNVRLFEHRRPELYSRLVKSDS